ncbi:MAG: putative hemolysin [Anaerolineae bacterium]
MNKQLKIVLGIVGGLLLVGLAAVVVVWLLLAPAGSTSSEPTVGPGAELPNPASAYCEEQGGRLEIRTNDEGGEYGVCIFADGSECEEWAFYRGECSPGR